MNDSTCSYKLCASVHMFRLYFFGRTLGIILSFVICCWRWELFVDAFCFYFVFISANAVFLLLAPMVFSVCCCPSIRKMSLHTSTHLFGHTVWRVVDTDGRKNSLDDMMTDVCKYNNFLIVVIAMILTFLFLHISNVFVLVTIISIRVLESLSVFTYVCYALFLPEI